MFTYQPDLEFAMYKRMVIELASFKEKQMKYYLKTIIVSFALLAFKIVNGQTKEATLILKDGTEFKGFGEIKMNRFTKNKKILFRMDLEDKPDVWKSDQVKRLEFDNGFEIVAYEYVKMDKYSARLYRVIESGFMTLYAYDDSYWSVNQSTLGQMGGSQKVLTTVYYVKRKDMDFPCPVVKNKKAWKKKLGKCFIDCKELMDIISSENIKDYEIEDLVWNFNEYCQYKE